MHTDGQKHHFGDEIITGTLTGEQIGMQTRIGIEASQRFNIVRRELLELEREQVGLG